MPTSDDSQLLEESNLTAKKSRSAPHHVKHLSISRAAKLVKD